MIERNLITSFINLPNPPQEAMQANDEKVKAIIASMGDKYLLANPMPKKGAQNEN